MPNGFDVNPDEIDAHAKAIDATAATLDAAVGAARARMGHSDFGAFGFVGAFWCNDLMDSATEALVAAQEAGQQHAQAVRAWAESNRVNEESITSTFGSGQ
ncbi:hypothetical protein ACOBQX_13665 [Actinokineospora sp. G85]|uniref:hypothetical protein n=1 Tax=Actinokineospora sp. G85 TaxID=3406626 RepID=UPI003C761F38